MARPREFDAELALDAAISVFREHGYEGSSAQMLVDTMGIGRQSLYAAFGDKWQLYRSAVGRYGMANVLRISTRFAAACVPSTESTLCCVASLKRPINLVSASVRSMSSAPPVPTSRRSTRCWREACAQLSPAASAMHSAKAMSPLDSTPTRLP